VLGFQFLNTVDKFDNLAVKACRAEADVEDVGVLATADHALLELGAIFRDHILDAFLLLEISGCGEVFGNHFIARKVPDSSFQSIILTTDFDHLVNQACLCTLKLSSDSLRELPFRHIRQHEHIFADLLLFEELVADGSRLGGVDYEVAKTFLEGHLDCDIVLRVDWLDELVKLAEVSTAPRP